MNRKADVEATGTPSGEGERRAMRGYVPQYDLAAHLIYEALAGGQLKWVGLADRGAGSFDDVVLGLQDCVVGYQIKNQRTPEAFGLKALLLGAEKLVLKLYGSWKRLRSGGQEARVKVAYVTRDFPRLNDRLGSQEGEEGSSAAFLRTHGKHGADWSVREWLGSPFSEFIKELIEELRIAPDEFVEFWQNVLFWTSDSGKQLGFRPATTYEDRRISAVSNILPRLVADPSDKDRWSADELLKKLGWGDPFAARHVHAFPLDSLIQSNETTEDQIQRTFCTISCGYISLVGPPGSGKSTLLQAGPLPIPSAVFVRYLAFVPDEGHGLGRAEAFDFLHDLISQLKRQGIGTSIIPAAELPELRLQFMELLRQAAERFESERLRTVIVIDGLDHIPREERPERSLLQELPLPHAIPNGVIFLLGTQRLDLEGLPPAVRDQAAQEGRKVEISALRREAVYDLVDAAGVALDVSRSAIFEKSEGHPLSVRYLVEGLLRQSTEDERCDWIVNGPAYGGDVSEFYESAWRGLDNAPDAKKVLSYLALAEGGLDPFRIDELVDSRSTDIAWRECLHLLHLDKQGRWSIFHNSFRLFLLEKTGTRFGQQDSQSLKRRYLDLARLARNSSSDDPQRWMELRYLARASDDEAVANVATSQRFRAEFVEGRNPADIYTDIRLALAAVGKLRDANKLFQLILSKHEIEMRSDAIAVEELVKAYIAVDELDVALGLVQADGVSLPITAPYMVIDALLKVGRNDEARLLFEDIEPIEKLLGSEAVDLWHRDEELRIWAAYALIFREPRHFLACLDRLREPNHQFYGGRTLDDLKEELRLIAARSAFEMRPDQEIDLVVKQLSPGGELSAALNMIAAESAYAGGLHNVARNRFSIASESVEEFDYDTRLNAARILIALDDVQLASTFMRGLTPPTLVERPSASVGWLRSASRRIVTYAACEVRIAGSVPTAAYPESHLLNAFQRRLEGLGRLIGRGRAGDKKSAETIWQEVSQTVTLLQFGGIEQSGNWERYELNQAMPDIAIVIVVLCSIYGHDALLLVSSRIDELLEAAPGPLRNPSFRRAYALEMFRHERSLENVERRLAITDQIGDQHTPHEYVQEVSETAEVLALCGAVELARAQLRNMHEGALGISRPPKKDAQYVMWRDVFQRSSVESPDRRSSRVSFFARLLDGLSQTEGSGSARRIAPELLAEAAQGDPNQASAVAGRLQEDGLLTWSTLIGAAIKGVATKRCDLAHVCLVLFGRMSLPFSDGYDQEIYPILLNLVDETCRETALMAAIDHIQVDAPGDVRVAYLRRIDAIAKKFGMPRPQQVIERWQSERGAEIWERRDDPYERIGSLLELSQALLKQVGDKKTYFAVKAFERIAPQSTYEDVRCFMSLPEMSGDERAIVVAARAAVNAGQIDDAKEYAEYLSTISEGRGSWGEWQSGTKLRLYQVLVELEGEQARRKAFDGFARDMARGGEWSDSLMPDLAAVFELFSPRPSWSEMWDALVDHLSLFRDFRLGRELPDVSLNGTEEQLLAELLFQGAELSSLDLLQQIRTTARDIVDCKGGGAVVVALLNRLTVYGGDQALEAARLAWELRHIPIIRDWAADEIVAWCHSDDLAIIRYGMLFATELEQELRPPTRKLPGIYRLRLPPSLESAAQNFEPPSGFSEGAPGMWTGDSLSLTWPLEASLRVLERAASFDMAVMRMRAAEFMLEGRGTLDFGPEAMSNQQATYRRLELHILHRRLPVLAAFRAVRKVAGELALAGELDLRCVPVFLSKAAAPDLVLPSLVPLPRPEGLCLYKMPSAYQTKEIEEWLEEEGAVQWQSDPTNSNRIIAAVGRFERLSLRRDAVEEHLMLFSDIDPDATSLDETMSALPRLLLCDGPRPTYSGAANGGIVAISRDIAGSIPELAITLCPVLADRVGLIPTGPALMSYRGSSGQIEVQVTWWRDGGVHRRSTDGILRGEGFVVTATDAAAARLRPFLGQRLRSHRWRSVKSRNAAENSRTQYSLADA